MSDFDINNAVDRSVADAVTPVPTAPDSLDNRTAPQGPQPTGPQAPGVNPGEQGQQPDAPQRPSLWKTVLAGALQGLAAGSQVNTKGMSGAAGFAAGAGAGANQVLNIRPQQQAQLDTEKARQALYHVNFSKVAYDLHKQMADDNDADLNQHIADDANLLKAGALRPVTMPTDSVTAMSQLSRQIQKDPAGQYRVSVTRGSDGEPAYQVVQSLNSPTQAYVTVKDRFGKDQVIPAGQATGAQIEQWRMHELATGLDMKQQQADENRKFKQQKELLEQKGDQAVDLNDAKATAQRTNSYGNNVVAFAPEYQNADGSKGANVVLDKGTAQQRGLFSYKADPSTINANIAGMNDVQTKLNQLAEVANDKSRMSQVQPELAEAILEHGKGIKIGIAGTEIDTSRVNEGLYKEDVNSANQATRDFVTAYIGAHEAITQLPRLQTFGKSSRMTETQLHAALNMLPQAGDGPSLAQQKMASLQNTIDPLRRQMPHMPGAELIQTWQEKQAKPPVATHSYDYTTGLLRSLNQ